MRICGVNVGSCTETYGYSSYEKSPHQEGIGYHHFKPNERFPDYPKKQTQDEDDWLGFEYLTGKIMVFRYPFDNGGSRYKVVYRGSVWDIKR